jgi:hypothetical protein
MIDLAQRSEPYEIALPYGLSVIVKPLTTAGMAAAQAAADGRLCPYREHALISRQEHEAWDVLLACQGQLRLATSGHVVGIEMAAALEIAAARRCDLAVFSELAAAAEGGLVETLCSDRVRG